MWYEIATGLFTVVVLVVLVGLYRNKLRRESEWRDEMRRTWKSGTAWMVVAMILLTGAWASAAKRDLGGFCWQLAPFVDRLEVEAVQVESQSAVVALHTSWLGFLNGQQFYDLEGGGMAVQSLDGTLYAVSIPLFNPSTFFNAQPLCMLQISLPMNTLEGPWAVTCTGSGGEVFGKFGNLLKVSCEVPPAAVASIAITDALRSAKEVSAEAMLAGGQR